MAATESDIAARIALQRRAAEAYLAAGISIIPVAYRKSVADAAALQASGSLDRRGRPTFKQYWKRPPGPGEIDTWFGSEPRNLGIVTGYRSLLILDFDDVDAFSTWRRRHPDVADRTAIQRTARGYHVLVRCRKQVRSALRLHQFRLTDCDPRCVGDVLGRRFYVTAWPSVHPRGARYSWLEGHAPWESGIAGISSLAEVGIRLVESSLLVYTRFLARSFVKPRATLRRLAYKRLVVTGRFDSETAPAIWRSWQTGKTTETPEAQG